MKKIFLTLLIIICFIVPFSQAEEKKSIERLYKEIKACEDLKQKKRLLNKLRMKCPKTEKEVKLLVKMAHSFWNKELREVALEALNNIKEEDKHLEDIIIKLLDDYDEKVRIAMIQNVVKLKSKKAAPKLRRIVKGFSGIAYKAVNLFSERYAHKMLWEPGVAAIALGELKDIESIPLLVKRFEELGSFAAEGLASMGRKAIPSILELIKKEKDKRKKETVCNALACIKDKEAKIDLMNIVKKEKDRDIRYSALTALVRYMYGDDVLEMAKNLYEKEKDSVFIIAMKTKKAIPFLINILKSDKDHDTRWYVASILGDLKDPSAVPALEEALKDRDRNVRQLAARALKKITGREYEWKKRRR